MSCESLCYKEAVTFDSKRQFEQFQALMHIKKGDGLRATKKGELVLTKKGKYKRTRQVRQILENIIDTLNREFDLSHKKLYKKIFFRRLSRLNTVVFDRCLIGKKVLKAIAGKSYQKLKAYQNFDPSSESDLLTTNDEFFDVAYAVIKLSLKLGIPPLPVSEGVNGTYFLRGLDLSNIGVTKPCDEEVLSENSQSPIRFVKQVANYTQLFRTIIFLQKGVGCYSERMAFLLAREIETNNVPQTEIKGFSKKYFNVKVEGERKVGSLQLYVAGASSVETQLKIKKYWYFIPKFPQFQLERKKFKTRVEDHITHEMYIDWVFIDFLTAQLDRTPNDLFIREQLFLIDNGISMPSKHPKNFFSKWNQNRFKDLHYATIPFSSYAKKKMKLLQKRIDFLIDCFFQENLISDLGQIDCFIDRVQLMDMFIEEGKTPRELAKVRSEKELKKQLIKRRYF